MSEETDCTDWITSFTCAGVAADWYHSTVILDIFTQFYLVCSASFSFTGQFGCCSWWMYLRKPLIHIQNMSRGNIVWLMVDLKWPCSCFSWFFQIHTILLHFIVVLLLNIPPVVPSKSTNITVITVVLCIRLPVHSEQLMRYPKYLYTCMKKRGSHPAMQCLNWFYQSWQCTGCFQLSGHHQCVQMQGYNLSLRVPGT